MRQRGARISAIVVARSSRLRCVARGAFRWRAPMSVTPHLCRRGPGRSGPEHAERAAGVAIGPPDVAGRDFAPAGMSREKPLCRAIGRFAPTDERIRILSCRRGAAAAARRGSAAGVGESRRREQAAPHISSSSRTAGRRRRRVPARCTRAHSDANPAKPHTASHRDARSGTPGPLPAPPPARGT